MLITLQNTLLYDDKVLLAQISEGIEHAFSQLFNFYRSKPHFYILAITDSKETAEDAVHDVF